MSSDREVCVMPCVLITPIKRTTKSIMGSKDNLRSAIGRTIELFAPTQWGKACPWLAWLRTDKVISSQ